MITIRKQLLIGLMSGVIIAILAVGIGSYLKVRHELNEIFDYQLKQIVRSFPENMSFQPSETSDRHPGKKIVVQVWDRHNYLAFTSNPAKDLPRYSDTGFFEISFNNQRWRVYSEENFQQRVQVAQLIADREKIEFSLAMRSLIPFLILIPVLMLLIWFVVGRSLQPLKHLANSLEERSADALHHVNTEGYPPEILPIVEAMNALFSRVENSIQLQRMFVADAAHELRTPLAALKLQLQLVEKSEDNEERARGMHKLHERLNRATHLVQQLLTLARHSSGSEQENRVTVSLSELAKQSVSDFSLLAENKNIDLGVDIIHPGLTVSGYPDALRVMLNNLVDNAIRYTRNNGRIDVIVCEEDHAPCLIVADTGIGVPPEDRERIFDRFFRCTGTEQSGSGLGLAIVKNIVDQHHASIRVFDAEHGCGLRFCITFPIPARPDGCFTANGKII